MIIVITFIGNVYGNDVIFFYTMNNNLTGLFFSFSCTVTEDSFLKKKVRLLS